MWVEATQLSTFNIFAIVDKKKTFDLIIYWRVQFSFDFDKKTCRF